MDFLAALLFVCASHRPGPGAGEEERVKGLVREVRELRGASGSRAWFFSRADGQYCHPGGGRRVSQ